MADVGEAGPPLVLVKGAGDFATGVIHALHGAGLRVVATELERPLAVRRWVALSEAIHEGSYTVEGVTAVRCGPGDIDRVLGDGHVPILVDPGTGILGERRFDAVVDARSAKRNLGTAIDEAPVVVAIGPGFVAGRDCHAVVETLAGPDQGRVMREGGAAPDTGVPYPLDSATPPGANDDFLRSLLIRSPAAGTFRLVKDIGTEVGKGDLVGRVETADGGSADVLAPSSGLVRGVIRDGTGVREGMKLGDIDPTMEMGHLCAISEKARAIGKGVLEAVTSLLTEKGRWPRPQ